MKTTNPLSPSINLNCELIGELVRLGCQTITHIQQGIKNVPIEVSTKSDSSPVTSLDISTNDVIEDGLKHLTPDIPIVSEENRFRKPIHGNTFWLVDPIDSTSSLLSGNGNFTTNFGLISDGVPVLGFVGVPQLNSLYYGGKDFGAYKLISPKQPRAIFCSPMREIKTVVVQNLHRNDQTREFLRILDSVRTLSISSSLKIIKVADGTAQVYPRYDGSSTWDIAAAHAILIAAGGDIYTRLGPLRYSYSTYRNPDFVVCTDSTAELARSIFRNII